MFYFIVNPIAGRGRGEKVWAEIRTELMRRDVPFQDYQLQYKGEANKIAGNLSSLREPFTAVIIGGDGTVNEFIDGLSDPAFQYVTLGCIPVGSANDFVLGLGLKTDPLEALTAILAPIRIRHIKVGSMKGDFSTFDHKFIISSGIGFDADVCNGSYRSAAKDFLNFFHAGHMVYLTTALGLLVHMKQTQMTIVLENGAELRFKKAFFIAAMSLPCEGGGFRFAPEADPESSEFQLVIAEGLTRFRILQILPLARKGRHIGKPGIHIYSSKKFTVRAEEKLCVHTDGEIPGFYNEVTFQVLPQRLAVIVS